MGPGEWSAIAGIIFTAGGFVWGHGRGVGKNKKQLENMSSTLNKCSTELETIKTGFTNCQLRSTQATVAATTALNAVETELGDLKTSVKENFDKLVDHIGERGVHTDAEWRTTILTRLDGMNTSFDNRMNTFEKVISDRITGLEKVVKNGGGLR